MVAFLTQVVVSKRAGPAFGARGLRRRRTRLVLEEFEERVQPALVFTPAVGPEAVSFGANVQAQPKAASAGATNNGGAPTTLTIDDSADSAAAVYTITNSTVQINNTVIVTYAGISGLTLNGGSGNNVYNVESTAASTPVTVKTGDGTDTVNLGSTGNSLSNLLGLVTIKGKGGATTLNINSQEDSDLNYVLTSTTLSLPANVYTASTPVLSFASIGNLDLNTGTGSSTTFSDTLIQGNAAGTSVTVNSGLENVIVIGNNADTLDDIHGPIFIVGQVSDSFNVGDLNSTANHTYTLNAVGGNGTTNELTRSGGSSMVAITYTGLNNLQLTGGSGTNTFNIDSLANNYLTRIYGGGGQDTFNISHVAKDLDTISGILDLEGSAPGGTQQNATVNIDDQNHAGARKWLLEPGALVAYPTTGSSAQAVQVYVSDIGTLTVNGGSGGNTFVETGTTAGTNTTVNTGAGNDTLMMEGAIADYLASLTVNGQGGTNTLDYSQFTGPVSVNLSAHMATGISGGIRNFQAVTGLGGH